MNEKAGINVVTDSEMQGFIEGLFDKSVPSIDPSWQMTFPDADSIPEDVEFVSVNEVTTFIKDLFKKT